MIWKGNAEARQPQRRGVARAIATSGAAKCPHHARALPPIGTLLRHDGEYHTVTDSGVPRYDARDNFLGYIGACVDVTDLLQKEQERHKSEERVALAAEAAHLGIWRRQRAATEVVAKLL